MDKGGGRRLRRDAMSREEDFVTASSVVPGVTKEAGADWSR